MGRALFVDGSVNPQTRVGYGACLCLPSVACLQVPNNQAAHIQTRRFENTSSTQLELEALLWALESVSVATTVTVYTDCQNIMQLIVRRDRLEANNFCNKKGEVLAHALLYRRFYRYYDALAFNLVKLKGHKPAAGRSALDQWFSMVDRAERAACKQG